MATRIRMRLKDRTVEFDPELVTIEERMAVRYGTGLPLEAFALNEHSIGLDTVAVWWWLGRRQGGEPRLQWAACKGDLDGLDPDEFEIERVDDDVVDAAEPLAEVIENDPGNSDAD